MASDGYGNDGRIYVEISCDGGLQPSVIAQLYTMCFPPLPTVEKLRLGDFTEPVSSGPRGDIENDQWLELLRPFTAVKWLHVSEEFQPSIASALQELVEAERQKSYPPCRISSWKGSSHLSRKPSGSSLPPDSFPVIL